VLVRRHGPADAKGLETSEHGGQLGRGHPSPPLQEQQQRQEPTSPHPASLTSPEHSGQEMSAFIPYGARSVVTIGFEEGHMATNDVEGSGTAHDPWILLTPPGKSEFEAYRDPAADPPALVVQVGSTQLRYHLRCIEDLHAMLTEHGDWMLLGNADEQRPAAAGTVEAWARAADNPVGGWYGLKTGLRGRFANYVPPVLEVLGLAEVEHGPRNNRMRAR